MAARLYRTPGGSHSLPNSPVLERSAHFEVFQVPSAFKPAFAFRPLAQAGAAGVVGTVNWMSP